MLVYKNWAKSPRSVRTDETEFAFCAEELKAAYSYWSNHAGGAIPGKKSLSPRSMKSFLGHIAIFEKKADNLYQIRLIGTHLTSVVGEMQGQAITEALPVETAQRWTEALDAVIVSQRPRRIVSHLVVGRLEYLEAEIFLAPLLDENKLVTMVLGVAAFTAGIQPSDQCGERRAYAGM